jgi:O-antigen/teichoic acid export membrane protein
MGQGLVVKVLRFALAFASHVVIRRALGPEIFGHYLIAQLWLDLAAAVASLGMGQVVLRFLPTVRLGPHRAAMRRLLLWALALQLVGWVAVIAVVHAAEEPLTRYLAGEVTYALVVLVAYLLGTRLVFDIVTQVYHAILDVRPITLATIGWQVVFLAGLGATVVQDAGAAGVIVSAAAANALTALWLLAGWRRRLHVTGEGAPAEVPLGRMLRYGIPLAMVGLLYNVVWRASEGFLINYHWGERAAGFFGAAYSLPQLILEFVPTAIWPIVMASYAAVFALDRQRAATLVEHYYKLLFLVVAPLGIGGALFGDHLFVMVYGEAYAPGADLARVFFVVQSVSFIGTPLSMSLYILEKSTRNLLVWLGAAIVNVALDLVLIPMDWRVGGVVPVAIAVALMPPAFWWLLRREGFVVRVPWAFIGRVYLASLSLLLLVPVRRIERSEVIVGVALLLGIALLAVAFRSVRVFRRDDTALIALIPWTPVRRGAIWLSGGVS